MEPETEDQSPDASHELDTVTLFSSSNHDGEMEAMAIHGIMEASGIPSVMVGPSTIPVLAFEVRVPRENLAEAQRVLAEAQAAGPAAAVEAEAASEEKQ
ncbi:MAG: hypothetical protein ABSH50_19765 [Bryobacteraceae bacterium]|jgi:hypothetical protein